MNAQCLDLDLHRLDLRFAGARVAEPRAVERIARSIERGGQIVPCVAVADPAVEVLQQSLFDGGEEWTAGTGAFQLEQATSKSCSLSRSITASRFASTARRYAARSLCHLSDPHARPISILKVKEEPRLGTGTGMRNRSVVWLRRVG